MFHKSLFLRAADFGQITFKHPAEQTIVIILLFATLLVLLDNLILYYPRNYFLMRNAVFRSTPSDPKLERFYRCQRRSVLI